MTTKSAEEINELALIDKVELRLALAKDPEKYSQMMDTFLCPLLLKLASSHSSVRTAIFNILKDVTSRLNTYPDIKLPVLKLLDQTHSPKVQFGQETETVRLYSLLLASKGVNSLNVSCQELAILKCCDGISDLPPKVAARLFLIFMKLISKWPQPTQGTSQEDETKTFYSLNDKDTSYMLNRFVKFFLLTPAKQLGGSQAIPRGYVCPGLSVQEVAFFTYDAGVTYSKDQLKNYKKAIFQFATRAMNFKDVYMVMFLSVVSVDSSNISDDASTLLKRHHIPYENQEFIDFIISLYIGDKLLGVPPVKNVLKDVILSVLNRSILATASSSINIIISAGLNSDEYKIRSQTLKFIQHVVKYSYDNLLAAEHSGQDDSIGFSIDISSLIRNNLHTEGWPRLHIGQGTPNFHHSIEQRRNQYETLGEILKKKKLDNLSYVEFFFQSLLNDLSEFRSSIQNCLTSITSNLNENLPVSEKLKLKTLLKSHLSDDSELLTADKDKKDAIMSLRFVCLRYCNVVYPFQDANVRMLNVMGFSKNNRYDVMEEAMKGLNPYWYKMNVSLMSKSFKDNLVLDTKEVKFPEFKEFVSVLLGEIKQSSSFPNHALKTSLNAAIRFALRNLISQAVYEKNSIIQQDKDWSLRIEKCLDVDTRIRTLVSHLVFSFDQHWFIEFLKVLMTEFVLPDKISNFHDLIFGDTLHTLLQFSNMAVLQALGEYQQALCLFIGNSTVSNVNDFDHAVEIFGMITCQLPVENDVLQLILKKLLLTIDTSEFAPILRTACSSISRYVAKGSGHFFSDSLDMIYKILELKLKTGKNVYKTDILKCLIILDKYGCYKFLNDKLSHKNIVDILKTKIMNDSDTLYALSYMLMNYDEKLEFFFNDVIMPTHQNKNTDFTFNVGECLTIVTAKWESEFLIRQLDVSGVSLSSIQIQYHRNKNFGSILETILKHCKTATSPNLIKSLCIWLLSIVQYCGQLEEVRSSVKEIHVSLMRFLVNRDELIQEIASRGLSIAFELGNADFKEDMVKQFFKSFTSQTSSADNGNYVGSETQLFDEGELKTGDGSVSTYKDVMNLATEVGDPSLVYKFMSLSKSSNLWSSKKGLAFGLGAIVSKTSLSEMLLKNDTMTRKLIPKLYRYKFDPNEQVANSMSYMWKILVPNSSEIIDEYFSLIMDELLTSIGNKEWRVREASAIALRDLLQLFPQNKYADRLEIIWTMAFRTMDDIKDSVRQEGLKLTRVISNILVKSIGKNKNLEQSQNVLQILIPFLMGSKGLNSDAEDIRNFSLETIINLVKDCDSKAMQVYISMLVEELCLLLSSLEPQMINYVALNADKYDINMNVLDAKRAHQASESPIMDTIEKLIDMAEVGQYEDLFNAIISTVKKSVGLPSKVGAAKLIKLSCIKAPLEISPYSGKFLKVCLNVLKNSSNEMITSSYAVAIGYLFKNCNLSKMIKYSEKIVEIYFEEASNTDTSLNNKLSSGVAIQAILNYSPNQFEQVKGIFVPFVFIAKFYMNDMDADEKDKTAKIQRRIKGIFNHIWAENMSNSESGIIQYYLQEIIQLNETHVKSNNFETRKMCLKSLTFVIEKIDPLNTNEKLVSKMFEILFTGVEGRVWDGKEIVLHALVQLCIKFRQYYSSNLDITNEVHNIFKVELMKKTKKYSYSAVNDYCNYCVEYPDDLSLKLLIDSSIGLGLKDSSLNDDQNLLLTDVDGDVEMADINVKSSQANISRETERNSLLENVSKACRWYSNKSEMGIGMKFPVELFEHILFNVSNNLSLKNEIVFTWRTELSICNIGKILFENFISNKDSIADVVNKDLFLQILESFRSYWEKIHTTIIDENMNKSIENVKIQLVRFAGLMIKSLITFNEEPLAKEMFAQIKNDMIKLYFLDSTSSIIKTEIKQIGIISI